MPAPAARFVLVFTRSPRYHSADVDDVDADPGAQSGLDAHAVSSGFGQPTSIIMSPMPAPTLVLVFMLPPFLRSSDTDDGDAQSGSDVCLGFHVSSRSRSVDGVVVMPAPAQRLVWVFLRSPVADQPMLMMLTPSPANSLVWMFKYPPYRSSADVDHDGANASGEACSDGHVFSSCCFSRCEWLLVRVRRRVWFECSSCLLVSGQPMGVIVGPKPAMSLVWVFMFSPRTRLSRRRPP